MTSRTPSRTEAHPVGGTISWFTLNGGRTFTVLGDGYPSEDDAYELHERDVDGEVIPRTEHRFTTWSAVHAYLDKIEAG